MVVNHLFSPPVHPTTPSVSSRYRAPTDRIWVGEQLCTQDVPVPVCKFEQLHILHRFLSRKVGPLPWDSTVPVYSEYNEWLWKDVFFQTPMSWLLPSLPPFSFLTVWLQNTVLAREATKLWFIKHNGSFKCLFFHLFWVFFWFNFAANVANLTVFRFAGRPGKYNKLFNRWRLEEVSAIRRHPKWVIIPAMTGLIIALCFRIYLEFSSNSSLQWSICMLLCEQLISPIITEIFNSNDPKK